MNTYQPFTLEDVQKVLREDRGWVLVSPSAIGNIKEHVFDWPVKDCPGRVIRVYTSVQISSGETRLCGKDAIRVCVPGRLKSRRINRTSGWRQRLRDRVVKTLEELRKVEKAWAKTARAAEVKAPSGLTEISSLLAKAGEHLKYPKISFTVDDGTVLLYLAGEKSKYKGQVMVTDGGAYQESIFYGRIDAEGTFLASKKAPEWVARFLRAFNRDPSGIAAEYGKKSGNCVFCRKALSTDESLAVGYGPQCAKHYSLPWGKVEVA